MRRQLAVAIRLFTLFGAAGLVHGQNHTPVPRPPAQQNGPEAGSIATDGYAPSPQWLGQTRAPRPAVPSSYRVETVASGLMGGYGFQFLPDHRILVSERGGRLRLVGLDGSVSAPLEGLPKIYARGPQGLCDVIPDVDFARNRTVFLSYTALPDGADPSALPRLPGLLTIARAQLSADDRRLEQVTMILNAEGIGGRMIQARDRTLFITSSIPAGVGIESVDWPQPQRLDSLMGKVLRINADGSVPGNNPFVGKPGARPEIYAYGIRDDQGVALHPATALLWTSEHGPKGGDEINAIHPGRNYGFPAIGYGREYSGKPINGDRTFQEGMEQPVYFWTPDIAPSGMSFYTGRQFPEWRNNLFVAALAAKQLVRLVLRNERVIAEERLLTELNTRIRDVRDGPDGALYVMTDGAEGKILRLIPSK
jgi:glucose/arabinose dehydrogenase